MNQTIINLDIRMCMNHLSLDIIGLAETHLKNSEKLQIAGYRWFG